MIERALAAGVPFEWVATDTIYGALAMQLRRAGKGYVLGVQATDRFNSWDKSPPVAGTAATIAQGLAPKTWQRLSAGTAPRGRACMIGPMSSWPISRPRNSTRR